MGEIHEWFDASHDIPVRILNKGLQSADRTVSTTLTLDALTDEAVTLDESGETHSVRCARYVGDSETVDLLGYTTGGMTGNIFTWLTCDIPGRVARRETTNLDMSQSTLHMSCAVPQVIAADSAKAQTIMKWVQAKIRDNAGKSIETQREHQLAQLLEAYLELMACHRTDGSKASLDEPNTAGSWAAMKAAYAEVRVGHLASILHSVSTLLTSILECVSFWGSYRCILLYVLGTGVSFFVQPLTPHHTQLTFTFPV